MSPAACPECGAALDELSSRCPECGESTLGRKRGELAGVRIDPERLERSLPDLEPSSGRWGKASERPGGPDDDSEDSRRTMPDPRAARRASDAPPPMPETSRESERERAREDETPVGRSQSVPPPPPASEASIEAPTPKAERLPAAAAPSAATAASVPRPAEAPPEGRLSPVPAPPPVALDPPPLDAEVVVLYPAPAPEPIRRPPSNEGRANVTPGRPPVLASEALLRELTPAKPSPFALRYCAAIIGMLGVAMITLVTGTHGAAIPFAAAFGALALLSLPPMPYAARAFSIMTVAGCGLMLSVFSNIGALHEDSLTLTISVTLLATGLFLRAFHRASTLARVLVALGVLVGATFLQVSGALRHLTMVDTAWQSWAPRVLGLPFGLLLMLSLLAFMDARTTAGCAVWASVVLSFHMLYACVQLLLVVWPKGASEANLAQLTMSGALSGICVPLFTALLSLALAQMLASTMAQTSSRPATLRV